MGTGLGMILKVVVINNDQLGKIGNMGMSKVSDMNTLVDSL